MGTFTAGPLGIDTDLLVISDLLEGEIIGASTTTYQLDVDGQIVTFTGTGFVYDGDFVPVGGTVTGLSATLDGVLIYSLSGISVPVTSFVNWALTGDDLAAQMGALGGADLMNGSAADDLMRAWGGADTVIGNGGYDELYGGAGNDSIDGGAGYGFLRGEEGDDWIVGGADTEDAHGNMGNDTVQGGAGDDWSVGGKDNDLLFGDDGHDVVWGNLGNDTCDGGAGNDQVRGGQGDDVVRGGGGDDWLSGDRGTDTITGGTGADIFHTFDGAGADRVTDFSAAEGDRVYVLAGHQYSVAQVGADTVVTVTGTEGGTLTLVGVTLSALPDGWIFGG